MKINCLLNVVVLVVSILLSANVFANLCIDIELPDTDQYSFEGKNLFVTSYDGTRIAANILTPKHNMPEAGFPAIIFVNSWVLDENQYLQQAKQFAEKGYVVMSYSTRGFGCSEGVVQVASTSDLQDFSAVVDYLVSRNEVDPFNIGAAGVSYGAGISLLALAHEPRIKTAVALSTWASLEEALYGQETPRLFWGLLLTTSGNLLGNLHEEIQQNFNNLLRNENVDETRAWSALRSPATYVDLINARNAPVFIANNFGDNLFQANSIIRFYNALDVPKRLELNQGTHVSGEGLGLLGLQNYTWNNIKGWFDHWLKDDLSVDFSDASITVLTDTLHLREDFRDAPQFPPNSIEQEFYLTPRGVFSGGGLSTSFELRNERSNTIYSGLDSGASTGIPALSALLDAHLRLPVTFPLAWLNRLNGISFKTEPLREAKRIRGIPRVSLSLDSSSADFQVMAYLYDVDRRGIATLITHGPYTHHGNSAGDQLTISSELVATAYDVPAGHSIALVLDTFDLLYQAPTLWPYAINFHFGGQHQPTLTLPFMP
ncbi:hypothetical protein TDB9533_00008 [Thalassocella blandensis]|nr:hypothetical protein TDB9533_00008 [Thalassocella blandensis]